MKTYKCLTANGKGPYSGASYDLSGKWLPKIEKLVMCESGYHSFQKKDVFEWLNERIFECETRGEILEDGEKLASQEIRFVRELKWNETNQRLFAADCAERVLPIFEERYPNDDRPRKAIEAARLYARGEIGAAARAAAQAAAGEAAAGEASWEASQAASRTASWAASWAASQAAPWAASWDASAAARRAASQAARRAAPWDAAGDVERKWQVRRLFEYLKGKRS